MQYAISYAPIHTPVRLLLYELYGIFQLFHGANVLAHKDDVDPGPAVQWMTWPTIAALAVAEAMQCLGSRVWSL